MSKNAENFDFDDTLRNPEYVDKTEVGEQQAQSDSDSQIDFKALKEFIDNEYDKSANSVKSFPANYRDGIQKSREVVRKHIEELFPNIKISDEILREIEFAAYKCHYAFKDNVPYFYKDKSFRRGCTLGEHATNKAEDEYDATCKLLFDCIDVSQKINPDNIDEANFEEFRQKNRLGYKRRKHPKIFKPFNAIRI